MTTAARARRRARATTRALAPVLKSLGAFALSLQAIERGKAARARLWAAAGAIALATLIGGSALGGGAPSG